MPQLMQELKHPVQPRRRNLPCEERLAALLAAAADVCAEVLQAHEDCDRDDLCDLCHDAEGIAYMVGLVRDMVHSQIIPGWEDRADLADALDAASRAAN
jgi:hypothetical protein